MSKCMVKRGYLITRGRGHSCWWPQSSLIMFQLGLWFPLLCKFGDNLHMFERWCESSHTMWQKPFSIRLIFNQVSSHLNASSWQTHQPCMFAPTKRGTRSQLLLWSRFISSSMSWLELESTCASTIYLRMDMSSKQHIKSTIQSNRKQLKKTEQRPFL